MGIKAVSVVFEGDVSPIDLPADWRDPTWIKMINSDYDPVPTSKKYISALIRKDRKEVILFRTEDNVVLGKKVNCSLAESEARILARDTVEAAKMTGMI